MFKNLKIKFKTTKALNFNSLSLEDDVFELFQYLEYVFYDLTKKVKDEKEKFELAIMICSFLNKYSENENISGPKEQAIYELSVKWLTYHFPKELYTKYDMSDIESIIMLEFLGIRNEYFYQKLIVKNNSFDIEENFNTINFLINYVYDEPCYNFHTKNKGIFKYALSYEELEPCSNFLNDDKYMFKKMRLFNDLIYQVKGKEIVTQLLLELNLEKYYDTEEI